MKRPHYFSYLKLSIFLVVSMMVTSGCEGEEPQKSAMVLATEFYESGDFKSAKQILSEYLEDSDDRNHLDLYIQCFIAQKQYMEAADVILSIYQKQGFEDKSESLLQTRMNEILGQVTTEEKEKIQEVLSSIPDSLEEKEKLDAERKEAKKQAKEEEKARTKIVKLLAEDLSDSDNEEELKQECTLYLEVYGNSEYATAVQKILEQREAIKQSKQMRTKFDGLETEYQKMKGAFYNDSYIQYRLESVFDMVNAVSNILEVLGQSKEYYEWVARYDFSDESDHIVRTKRVFSESGLYELYVVEDGFKKVKNIAGFEKSLPVYREVNDFYIQTVNEQYIKYLKADTFLKNAYKNMDTLKELLASAEVYEVKLKPVTLKEDPRLSIPYGTYRSDYYGDTLYLTIHDINGDGQYYMDFETDEYPYFCYDWALCPVGEYGLNLNLTEDTVSFVWSEDGATLKTTVKGSSGYEEMDEWLNERTFEKIS